MLKRLKTIVCAVVCLSILGALLPAVNIHAAEQSFVMDFDGDTVGSANGNFVVAEAGGRRFLQSANTGFGATGNLYAGQLGDAIQEGFEISAEFMFPAGTEGILWLYMKGMSAANDFQMMDVSFAGGVTRVYAQDGPSLGNIDDTSPLGVQVAADTWHTMKVVKESALYTLYLDDVKVLEYTYADTDHAPTEICLMQYLTAGSGVCVDTLTLKTLPPKVVAAESVCVTPSASGVVLGNSTVIRAEVSPANANNYTEIEWYVKVPGEAEYTKRPETGTSIVLSPDAVGDYSIYAQAAGVASEAVTVEATEPADKLILDFETDEVGTVNGNFAVVENAGDQYLASSVSGFGATDNLYAGQLGSGIQEAFEISADFMFPAGSEGIVWLYMKGMTGINDFQMMDVSFAGGVTRVYAQDGESLGNIDDTSPLGVQVAADTWHTMKVVKENALYTLYLDDVKVLEYTYIDTDHAPTEIYLMQFLTAGSGVCFDDLKLLTAAAREVPVESVEVVAASNTVVMGNAVSVQASYTPANANNFTEVEWYVKAPGASEYVKRAETAATISLVGEMEGQYCVYAKLADKQSETVTITVTAPKSELVLDFEAEEVGAVNNNFTVAEKDGNKYLVSAVTGFGATDNLYAGQLGDRIAENFVISADFMFPAGSEGIVWLYMKGMSAVNDFQMMDVSFTGGVTRVYAQDGEGLGNIDDTSPLGVQVAADTWHTMKVVKESALYTLYLDDVKVLEYAYPDTNHAPTEIWLMQFLTAGSSAAFDNLTIRTLETGVIEAEGVTVEASATDVRVDSAVRFVASVKPANANHYTAVEWYVQAPGAADYVKQEQSGVTLELTGLKEGTYSVYAKVGDHRSEPVTVKVTKANFKVVDTSGWGILTGSDFSGDMWPEGAGWGGSSADTFKSDGKGKMHHLPGEPKLKVGVAWFGDSFPDFYTVEMDVSIGAGSRGQVWYCLENLFKGEDGKWTSVGINYQGDEWYAFLSSDTYGELARSDASVNIKELCGYDKEFRMVLYKYGDGLALFINGTKVLEWVSDGTVSLDTDPTWLNVLSLVDGDEDTLSFDNFLIRNGDEAPRTGDIAKPGIAFAVMAFTLMGGAVLAAADRRRKEKA